MRLFLPNMDINRLFPELADVNKMNKTKIDKKNTIKLARKFL